MELRRLQRTRHRGMAITMYAPDSAHTRRLGHGTHDGSLHMLWRYVHNTFVDVCVQVAYIATVAVPAKKKRIMISNLVSGSNSLCVMCLFGWLRVVHLMIE